MAQDLSSSIRLPAYKDYSNMSIEQLRQAVEEIHDTLIRLKRVYDVMLENTNDSFNNSLKNITLTVDKLLVNSSKTNDIGEQLESYFTVSADKIESKVMKSVNGQLVNYSTVEQTAKKIESVVASVNGINDNLKNYSTLTQTSDAIKSVVSAPAKRESAIEVSSLEACTDTNKVYLVKENENDSGQYYYFNSLTNSWEIVNDDSIYSVFTQTEDGFELKGNVVIDGNTVVTKNLTLSGNITWDMDNSPVKTQYSANSTDWHDSFNINSDKYMKMTFDGGKTWSNPIKVVGSDGNDGNDGTDGSDANVTPDNVFNALTNAGAKQGIFAVFENNNNKLYINAKYISSDIQRVDKELRIGKDSADEQKTIWFYDTSSIRTTADGLNSYLGIEINAPLFRMEMQPNSIYFKNPSDTSKHISLEDYVKNNAGSGSATAVFG